MVVLYPKDTEKWKQFTTRTSKVNSLLSLFCIPKILKNESNSQLKWIAERGIDGCFVSQRYWKMKAIHNEKPMDSIMNALFCIPKILKNESNSQHRLLFQVYFACCFVSQRYWKMKAIHNNILKDFKTIRVVLYPKDTEKWKQFTTIPTANKMYQKLFCIPKILKNESNSQQKQFFLYSVLSCFVSQRYWKMKAIHNTYTIGA